MYISINRWVHQLSNYPPPPFSQKIKINKKEEEEEEETITKIKMMKIFSWHFQKDHQISFATQ